MARLVLVRHAEPTASWGDHLDPGLSVLGREQADAVAASLASRGPVPIVTSPLLRAQETAAPLPRRWGIEPRRWAAVGEIPTPSGLARPRVDWLREVLAGHWPDVEPAARQWRAELLDAVRAIDELTMSSSAPRPVMTACGRAHRPMRRLPRSTSTRPTWRS